MLMPVLLAQIVLGFFVWMLLALLYDMGGVVAGIPPGIIVACLTIAYRFELIPWIALVATVPVLVRNAWAVPVLARDVISGSID